MAMANLSRRFTPRACALVRRLSTEINSPAPSTSTAFARKDCLFYRLFRLGHNYKVGTAAGTINEYIREGIAVRKRELEHCIIELRKSGRFNHALEILEWMEVQKYNFVDRHCALRLDLIAKAKGIAAAENYFSGLSPSTKVYSTYLALLNCYVVESMTDKAADLFGKMVKENMVCKAEPFNKLMLLCMKLGQTEKVAILREEMKKNKIQPDTFTYIFLMKSYSLLNDIEGVERVFEEMKRENGEQCNWTTYGNLAVFYMKSGYKEKAASALQNLAKEMPSNNREPYHFLITLYAGISDLDNVHLHRIWKSLKSTLRVVSNKSYIIVLQALRNLNDIKGIKECFEEWESGCSHYNVKLANTVIDAYLRHDMLEEATLILQNAASRSEGPFFIAWEMFVVFFLKINQLKPALQKMDIATSKVCDDEWRPRSDTINRFLNYFRKEGDVCGAEEFYKFMKRVNCVNRHMFELLLQTYVAGLLLEEHNMICVQGLRRMGLKSTMSSNICLYAFAPNDKCMANSQLFILFMSIMEMTWRRRRF